MSKTGYLILAIAVIVALAVIFIVSFILYVKTPVPKGCEKTPSELCSSCSNKRCEFYLYEEKGELAKEKESKEKENQAQ